MGRDIMNEDMYEIKRPLVVEVYDLAMELHDLESAAVYWGLGQIPVLLELEMDCKADWMDRLQRDLGAIHKPWLTDPTLRDMSDSIETLETLDFCSGREW